MPGILRIFFNGGEFPNFIQVVKTTLCIFYGPRVESSFNLMDDIVDKRSTKINVDTFSSIQTIKYGLKARNRDAKTVY